MISSERLGAYNFEPSAKLNSSYIRKQDMRVVQRLSTSVLLLNSMEVHKKPRLVVSVETKHFGTSTKLKRGK